VYDDYIYFVLKTLYIDPASHEFQHEQISLILGAGYVISLQEMEGDVFEPVRARIKGGSGLIRKRGSDYLAYALLDTIVDHYFKSLEELVEKIEDLQDQVITDPGKEILNVIQQLKHEMLFVRRSVWPLREIITSLIRDESRLIDEKITIYLRDLYDHTLQVIDTVESIRDMLSGLLDVYLSSVSNRMNEVMKVLTIIATIFIPLTFIAGIYGMNFNYMPELNWKWSYPVLWLVMLAILAVMIVWLKRRKWF
jgi:magnesium transporter